MAQIKRFFPTTLGTFSGDGKNLTNIVSSSYAVTASFALSSLGGAGTPGGSTTQIQYNNAGAFGGVSNLTFDGTVLSATGSFTGSFIGSLSGTSSYATTASFAMNANGSSTFPFTGSANITGSLFLVGSSSFVLSTSQITNDFFLVRNATTTLKVIDGVQVSSSAQSPLQILNTNNNNLLQVSQSGIIILATSSIALTGTAPYGSIYFTSNSFFVGLD